MTLLHWWLPNVLERMEDRAVEYAKLRAVRLLLVLDNRSPVSPTSHGGEEYFAQAVSYWAARHRRLLEEGQ